MDDIKEILAKTDIVDVISEYIDLERKGKNYFGVCPFHDDTNPSMSVSEQKQIFKCFSCGATGDAIEFVKRYENISFANALSKLGSKVGIDVVVKSNYSNSDNYFQIYNETVKMFQYNLLHTSNGLKYIDYLKDRGFSLEEINYFNIGLSSDELGKYLSENFDAPSINKTFLLDDSGNCLFKNRIVFPITNQNGDVVALSGRVINDSTPKYFNSPQTAYFVKSNILYNYFNASKHIASTKSIIITEGFFDVIRLHTIGLNNVVATMGTAFTKNHASLVSKGVNKVYLNFDGDNAGISAALNTFLTLYELKIDILFVNIGNNDPDNFILKYGRDDYLTRLNSAKLFEEFYLDYLLTNYDSYDNLKKRHVLSEAKEFIQRLRVEELQQFREYVFAKTNVLLDVSVPISTPTVKQNIRSNSRVSMAVALVNERISNDGSIEKIEFDFVCLMYQNREAIDMYVNNIKSLSVSVFDQFATILSEYYIRNSEIEFDKYLSNYDINVDKMNEIYELVKNSDVVYSEELLYDVMYRITLFKYEKKLDEYVKLLDGEFDMASKLKLVGKINEVKRNIEDITKRRMLDERD